MPVLNDADTLLIGTQTVDKMYLGTNLVWQPTFKPNQLSGCVTWLDAADLLTKPGVLSPAQPILTDTAPTQSSSGNLTLGIRFQMAVNGAVTALRYWHAACGTTTLHKLSLWDGTTQGKLVTVTDDGGGGQVEGWRVVTLPTPIPVIAGSWYMVSWSTEGYGFRFELGNPDPVNPAVAATYSYYAGGSDQYPTTNSGANYYADAVVQPYRINSWPNKAFGAPVRVVGTPVMATGVPQNGRTTVRFTYAEGRVRGDWPYPIDDWTVLYTMRWVGPNPGRSWTVCYPPSNLLIGTHTTGVDTAYCNGAWLGPNPGSASPYPTPPGDWKLYEGDGDSTSATVGFYINGTAYGRYGSGSNLGLTGGWGLSGYDPVTTQETLDIEVGELIIYNRRLSDAERIQVEGYLRTKWGLPTPPGLYDPDTSVYLSATGLDSSYAAPLDTLVTSLKSAGLWTKMSAIYPFIGGTAALHKWNLKDPRDLDAAYRLTFYADTGAHSTALGYRANPIGATVSAGGYADTHFVPLGVLTQDSTHLAFYSTQDVSPHDRAEMGCYTWGGMANSRFHIIARYLGVNAYYYGMSEQGASNVGVPAASGLFVATRTGPNAQTPYRNGVNLGTSGVSSVPLPDIPVYIGAINEFANRSDIPCGFASIGSGLDDRNVSDLYNIVQAYQTALNRQV